jgi:hypothetical protein
MPSGEWIDVLSFVRATVVMRLQRLMWISRQEPGRPALQEFSADDIDAVVALKKVRRVADDRLTMGQVTLWIAELGGYTGKSSGGPAGAITLGRGIAWITPVARALRTIQKERSRDGNLEM